MLTGDRASASVPLGRILLRLRCTGSCSAAPIRFALLRAQERASTRAGYNGVTAWELLLLGEDVSVG